MLVVWFCWPRSGSTWASSCLAKAVGLPWNPEGGVVAGEDALHRVHWTASAYRTRLGDEPCKKILSVRDPRDTVVSYYYHICHARENITVDSLSLLNYIRGNFLFLTPRVLDVMAGEPPCSWAQFYEAWIAEGIDVETRHEDMLSDPQSEIERLTDALDLPIVADIQDILDAYPETMRAPFTREFTEGQVLEETVPRGVSRWYERLSGEGETLIRRFSKEIMERYGYE